MPKVLLVDDDDDVRELVRITLEAAGYEMTLAPDGQAALELAERVDDDDAPDVVLLDVMMPGMDGWEVLTRLKATGGRLASVPVVMLTARQADVDRIRSSIEGAIGYLSKPFSVADLPVAVAEAMQGFEPDRRREVQTAALTSLARLESGTTDGSDATAPAARPHLTRLERPSSGELDAVPVAPAPPARRERLSPKQVELLNVVASEPTVSAAAIRLSVSRSNVYASLRRIARKLDVDSVPELVRLARAGGLHDDQR